MPGNPVDRGERAFVARLARVIPDRRAAPFGDDMAGIDDAYADLLWSCDMLMDGVDFRAGEHAWRDIGWKAMAVNLSDAAAMAARPVAALCAIALAEQLPANAADELLDGVRSCGEHYGCPLTGGDTNSWRFPTVICVSVAARVPAGARPALRSGARPGDRLFVTGPLGGSILGRHLRVRPRVAEALEIARTIDLAAMIDISDGLSIDLSRICDASGVGAELSTPLLERAIHDDARVLARSSGRSPLDHAMSDGEDFELLLAARSTLDIEVARPLGLIEIGQCVIEAGLTLRAADGSAAPLSPSGWEHRV